MKVVIGIVIALLIIGGGAFFVMNRDDASKNDTATDQTLTDGDDHSSDSTEQTSNEDEAAPNSTEAVQTNNVSIQNSSYSPGTITIKKGTTVTWTNKDSIQHDVTPDSPSSSFPGSDGLLSKDQTYSNTFSTTGTFTYHCTPHPFMKGTIVVTD